MTTYIDPLTGKQIAATDPRTLATPEARKAAAQANQDAFDTYHASQAAHRGCVCAQCRHS